MGLWTSRAILPAMGARPGLNHSCAVRAQTCEERSSSLNPEPTDKLIQFSNSLCLMFENRTYPFGLNKPLLSWEDWRGEVSFKGEILDIMHM